MRRILRQFSVMNVNFYSIFNINKIKIVLYQQLKNAGTAIAIYTRKHSIKPCDTTQQ